MELNNTEVAILLETVNKYTPTTHKFRLQSVTGLKENSLDKETRAVSTSNLLNKDTSTIPTDSITISDIVELTIPRDVSRNYPTKFIPPGTRFIVSFTAGDVTKPVIIGREF